MVRNDKWNVSGRPLSLAGHLKLAIALPPTFHLSLWITLIRLVELRRCSNHWFPLGMPPPPKVSPPFIVLYVTWGLGLRAVVWSAGGDRRLHPRAWTLGVLYGFYECYVLCAWRWSGYQRRDVGHQIMMLWTWRCGGRAIAQGAGGG
jgi:hypothetical protein